MKYLFILSFALGMMACHSASPQPTTNTKDMSGLDTPIVKKKEVFVPLNISDAKQLILMRGDGENSIYGTVSCYEKNEKGEWIEKQDMNIPVTLGKNGLAANPNEPHAFLPAKQEGDGKTPCGFYGLSEVFGYGSKPEWLKMPYTQCTPELVCVDDIKSVHYGKIADKFKVGLYDWNSAEQMLRDDELYEFGIVIDYNNKGEIVKGAGSCIFMHHWRNSDKPTAGCTATSPENLQKILRWLDSEKKPLFGAFLKGEEKLP